MPRRSTRARRRRLSMKIPTNLRCRNMVAGSGMWPKASSKYMSRPRVKMRSNRSDGAEVVGRARLHDLRRQSQQLDHLGDPLGRVFGTDVAQRQAPSRSPRSRRQWRHGRAAGNCRRVHRRPGWWRRSRAARRVCARRRTESCRSWGRSASGRIRTARATSDDSAGPATRSRSARVYSGWASRSMETPSAKSMARMRLVVRSRCTPGTKKSGSSPISAR